MAEIAGEVIITWPHASPGALAGWAVTIEDAATGWQITTVMEMTLVHAAAEAIVWAELTMFADEDGRPVFDSLKPHLRDGNVITGTFNFAVKEMRVAETAP